ncbi:MAG: hypothetical protein MHMPM18_000540 [Marteilia pararefringens]
MSVLVDKPLKCAELLLLCHGDFDMKILRKYDRHIVNALPQDTQILCKQMYYKAIIVLTVGIIVPCLLCCVCCSLIACFGGCVALCARLASRISNSGDRVPNNNNNNNQTKGNHEIDF